MTTTIVKWGNSRGIRLPKPFLEGLNLKDNDIVDVITENNTIIIKKPTRRRKTMKQRLEEFHGKDIETILREADASNEQPAMIDWGKPVGEELW